VLTKNYYLPRGYLMPATYGPVIAAPDDPLALFAAWLDEANKMELNDPNAMALATADANGQPSVRMVLLKDYDERGFVFYTNSQSRKGEQLAANMQAALLFHWKSLRRQVRLEGTVNPVSGAEADAYFATRPREAQLGAWASDQSRPLTGRAALEEAVKAAAARFEGQTVPRPPHWQGYRLQPLRLELWQEMPYRLHDRVLYTRATATGDWTHARLYP
jgi:pyridoxamine 5'-phosphate oxidase